MTLTIQEMFNKAWHGLKSQGFTMSTHQSACVYGAPGEEKHCAIGWLIDDESYNIDIEGCSIRELMENPKDKVVTIGYCKVAELHMSSQLFLRDLQRIHDECYNIDQCSVPERMKNEMVNLAYKYRLTVPGENNG